jgi:predicted alpha/beta hydrolase
MRGFPPGIGDYERRLAHAYLALARADSAAALREFQALPDSECYSCGTSEITEAQLLEAAHRDREALALVSAAGSGSDYYSMTLTLERGRIAERLGEKEIAVDSYARVAGMWQNGDAFLQPYVKEARAALLRLGGERAKGIPIAGAPTAR